jgi:aspartate racemase
MPAEISELTVGVIGGMGPYATLAFLQCLLGNTPADKDWDHLRTIVDNNPKIPSRTRAFLFGESDPVPMMAESARGLVKAGADFIVVPCNSAHYFLPRVQDLCQVPFLNMIDVTAEAVLAANHTVVGVLAGEVTVQGTLYEQRLHRHGVEVLQVSDEQQKSVRLVIEHGKRNIVTEETRGHMQALMDSLHSRGSQAIILGCTELPIVTQTMAASGPLIDSLDILAKATVRRARGAALRQTGRSGA